MAPIAVDVIASHNIKVSEEDIEAHIVAETTIFRQSREFERFDKIPT